MEPESKYRKRVSSSKETALGLTWPEKNRPWIPDERSPWVEVTIDESEDVYIDEVIVTRTENVRSVEAVLFGKNRRPVRLQNFPPPLIILN